MTVSSATIKSFQMSNPREYQEKCIFYSITININDKGRHLKTTNPSHRVSLLHCVASTIKNELRRTHRGRRRGRPFHRHKTQTIAVKAPTTNLSLPDRKRRLDRLPHSKRQLLLTARLQLTIPELAAPAEQPATNHHQSQLG